MIFGSTVLPSSWALIRPWIRHFAIIISAWRWCHEEAQINNWEEVKESTGKPA